MQGRGPGRPASKKETIDRQEVDAKVKGWVKDYPHLRMTLEEQAEAQEWLDRLEGVQKEILRTKHSSATTDAHAYAMADLDGSEPVGYTQALLAKDRDLKAKADSARRAGGTATQAKAEENSERLLERHKDLLARLKPVGNLTVNGAALIIHEGAKTALQGPGGSPLSVRQITRLIAKKKLDKAKH